jgi:hypothetical protein
MTPAGCPAFPIEAVIVRIVNSEPPETDHPQSSGLTWL